ncbi:MAG: hypothetical protein ACRD22_20320, partial [Terriglobia bacterium]
PMGIEWVLTPSATKPVNLSRADATVQEIIEALAKSQPGYEVEIRNRIVHVAPSGLAHRAQNFLDLRVGDFEVRNEAEEMVNRRLYEVANATVSPPKPQSGTAARGIGGSLLGEVGAPNVSVSLRNATVEDVLDALSLASDKRIWVVTFCADKALTPTGFRRTVSLWNNSPIPDSEQPIWDMFEWGRQPPNPLAALRQRDNTCKQH